MWGRQTKRHIEQLGAKQAGCFGSKLALTMECKKKKKGRKIIMLVPTCSSKLFGAQTHCFLTKVGPKEMKFYLFVYLFIFFTLRT